MSHQNHITNERYRQWVKAGLGLAYLKEGLVPFCDDVSKQQHENILDNIKRVKNVPSVMCGACTLKTLQPDHVKLGKKQCPYVQANCNCCYTFGKIACPNKACGFIYDSIITHHASTPPAPNWKNTQTQQWTADPWSIAKCFINAPGYEQKTSAADTDCTGLLHVIINNKYFHNHVSCNMTGPNIFSKVRQYRNEIFHSSTMELDSPKTNSYIDDMIVVLQDGKELIHRQDAQEAVKKLKDLKNKDFVITTHDIEKVLGDIREEMGFMKITMEATKEDCEDLKLKVATLETLISELKEKKRDYDELKTDLREKLIDEYKKNLLQVSAMPCQPEHLSDFRDVYVTPWIIIKSKDKERQDTETDVETMTDIFVKDGKSLKSIYILGEAGSGKSSFCKSLVNSWCMSHSNTQDFDGQQAEKSTEEVVGSYKVMKNFNFLFFLPLRHYTNKVSIKEMLEEEYEHTILKELLKRESETCLIVLDGLDEWTHGAMCPPKRAKFSNYTVITTSRPWKISSLGISDNEVQQSIHIHGFGKISKTNIIKKTVNILNKTFKKDKDPQTCEEAITNTSFNSYTDTAIMLQQLICLWFDDRLHETFKSNIYTCMLDLSFVWYKTKNPGTHLFKDIPKQSNSLDLPENLKKTDECKSHSYIIQVVSRLAYETLLKNEKESSLTFDNAMFQKLDISDEIKTCCLKLGILSEEEGPSLSASRRRKSHIFFSHKSIQEYMAALHIVLNNNLWQESSLTTERAEQSYNLSTMLNVRSLDELLEQENLLIMLCGLEPRLAKSVSTFITDIVARDERVVKYRTTIEENYSQYFLLTDVQNLILNCIDETKASNKNHHFSFDLMDLIIGENKMIFGLNESVDVQNITLENVFSIRTDILLITKETIDSRIYDCMTKLKNLEAINIFCDIFANQRICDSIEANASTLKCLSVKGLFTYESCFNRPLLCYIANMTNLVALQLRGFTVTHAHFTSLCTFLSGTGNLQQISIGIKCECNQQHEVDLSKHKQLQYLEYNKPVVVINAVCANLEVISCASLNQKHYKQSLDFLSNSLKLKEIYLACDVKTSIRNLSNFNATVTNRLITFLPPLKQLCLLDLGSFTLTDNIIKCPSEMKSLETIHLTGGRMSLTTWQRFVDSVGSLPQRVKVESLCMYITRDGEECNPDINWWRGEGVEEAAAFQYVREREALFDVSRIGDKSISFSTKK